MKNSAIPFIFMMCLFGYGCSNTGPANADGDSISVADSLPDSIAVVMPIVTGAEKTGDYLPLLEGKRVALVANHTTLIGDVHLADSLLSLDVNLVRIFCPEHGFRGNADAGEQVGDFTDAGTGIPVVSLYGNKKKPSDEDLQDVEIVIFDIQDVGARFYTYISTMHYVMEACAENEVEFLVLDRPNPNGYYVDGPVLDPKFSSFIGMHPVPVVHGMTIAEYAGMINGEGWLKDSVRCDLHCITCDNYTHDMQYDLPVKPSPNLPNSRAVKLYPSLCFFEGTELSVGRGTDMQFQVIGHPAYTKSDPEGFSFVPMPNEGAKNPVLQGKTCRGFDLRSEEEVFGNENREININFILYAYEQFPDKKKFFRNDNLFSLLAGSELLKKQIVGGMTDEEIRATWKDGLDKFRNIRKKYLLYPDFE